MGWFGVVLAFGMFWAQTLPYIGAVSACENADAGTSRAGLCNLMSPWGHIWILAVPPLLVLVGGILGQRAHRLRILLASISGAVILGLAFPLIAFEITSPR
jgi:hypothetical protein